MLVLKKKFKCSFHKLYAGPEKLNANSCNIHIQRYII
jgi:hypothetical protein